MDKEKIFAPSIFKNKEEIDKITEYTILVI